MILVNNASGNMTGRAKLQNKLVNILILIQSNQIALIL